MNKQDLKHLIQEELKNVLKEEYQDQYKVGGRLITNIKGRPQKEVNPRITRLQRSKFRSVHYYPKHKNRWISLY
jgi:hypothetical protein